MINPANFAHILGRLTSDPEVRTTASGISAVRFTVAVDRGYVKQGEEKQADFIDCSAFRQTAEFLGKYFRKGDVVEIVGDIETRSYTDKNGANRKATEILCERVAFVPGTKSSGSGAAARPQTGGGPVDDPSDLTSVDGDGLPF